MQKQYIPTPKKIAINEKPVDQQNMITDNLKMKTYTSNYHKKDGTMKTYTKTYILKDNDDSSSILLENDNTRYYTTQYIKKNGTLATYKSGYIPRKRIPNKCVIIDREIQANLKKLKKIKDEGALTSILEFMKHIPNLHQEKQE